MNLSWTTLCLILLCFVWPLQGQAASGSLAPWQKDIQHYLENSPDFKEKNFNILWPRRLPQLPACSTPLHVQSSNRPVPAGWLALSLKCERNRWTRAIDLRVLVLQRHLVTVQNLMTGHVLTERDLSWAETDGALLGHGFVIDMSQVIGRELRRPLTAASPLRLNNLQEATVITKGSIVTVIMRGSGFELETRGQAMENAPLGGTLRINIKQGTVLPARVIGNGLVLAD